MIHACIKNENECLYFISDNKNSDHDIDIVIHGLSGTSHFETHSQSFFFLNFLQLV